MNDSQSAQWPSAPQHYDTMQSAVAEQDLNTFFDLDALDFDIPSFDTNGAPPQDQNVSLADPAQLSHQRVSQPSTPQDHAAFYDFNMPMYTNAPPHTQAPYAFRDQHAFIPHHDIPPTPNSLDLHGGAARFMQQHQQQQSQHHHQQMDPQNPVVYQLRKDDAASFTPLVSPAVTPHETHFRIPNDFSMTPNGFSPLTSPALEAQRHQQRTAYQNTPANSGSSAAPSPADGDIDMLDPPLSQPDAKPATRSKKKTTTRSGQPTPRVRQSPIVKAQRRQSKTAPKPPKEVAALLEEAVNGRNGHSATGLEIPRSGTGSEASISPEPLTESLMGPPPRPHSMSQSPNLAANRNHTSGAQKNGVMPATPATLMRLQGSPDAMSPMSRAKAGQQSVASQPILEELELPEAAQRPSVARQLSTDDVLTPRVVPRKTPKLGPLSTPSGTLLGKSPNLSATQSPLTPTLMSPGGELARKDAKSRQSKKRNSTSSTLVSPALRPKISPSIKPLAPSGASFDESHAALLSVKSNYQNILDGTHVPGVVYPEALSTNLTSKRTSHKIAEQGRRNRINTALQEMQSLLPSPVVAAKSPASGKGAPNPADAKSPTSDGGKDGDGKGGAQGNSKAATVELAIDYIKKLQEDQKTYDDKMAEKDKELEELRRKMSEMESRLRRESTGDTEA